MIKHIKPLPISEEMLGAYLEGNLSLHDAEYVEQMLQRDGNLSSFVDELSMSEDIEANCLIDDVLGMDWDFGLPEIPMTSVTSMDVDSFSPYPNSSLSDVAACDIMSEAVAEVDIIKEDDDYNIRIEDAINMNIDINSEDGPTI